MPPTLIPGFLAATLFLSPACPGTQAWAQDVTDPETPVPSTIPPLDPPTPGDDASSEEIQAIPSADCGGGIARTLDNDPDIDDCVWTRRHDTFTEQALDPISEFKAILLGTGGPRPKYGQDLRAGPSNLVILDGTAIMVDAGPGATYQFLKSGVPPSDLRLFLFTHTFHYDHTVDYASLVLTRWNDQSRSANPLVVKGPAGTYALTEKLLDDVFLSDIQLRCRINARWTPVEVEEISPGIVWQTPTWRIRAGYIPHGEGALGYRFETKDRCLAIMGDVSSEHGPSVDSDLGPVIDLVRGCSLVIADSTHLRPVQLAKIGIQAEVPTMVLSHFRTVADPDEISRQIRRSGYKGRIIGGQDQMILEP